MNGRNGNFPPESAVKKIAEMNKDVYSIYLSGQYSTALELAVNVGAIAVKEIGDRHPEYAVSVNNLGIIFSALGRHEEAEKTHEVALDIRLKVLGENDLFYSQSLNNLAHIYHSTGRYKQAELFYEKALCIRRTALGSESPAVATLLGNLGLLYQDMGKFLDAEILLQQAVDIQRKLLGEDDFQFANSLNNLGVLYRSMGDFKKAEKIYHKVVKIRQAILGEQHPDFAVSLSNLAELFRVIGDYDESERIFLRAQDLLRKTVGETHPDFATNLNNLAMMYFEVSSFTSAEPLLLRALEIFQSVQHYPAVFSTYNNLGLLYQSTGNLELAESIFRKVLQARSTNLGDSHHHTTQSMNNLATLLQSQSKFTEANRLYHQSFEIRKSELSENHPDVAESLNNLAVLNIEMGNIDIAEKYLRKSLELRRNMGQSKILAYSQSLISLAVICVATNRAEEANSLMEEAFVIQKVVMEQLFSIGSEMQRMTYLEIILSSFYLYLSLILQEFSHDSKAVRMAMDMVLRTKALGAEALSTQREVILRGRYPKLKPKLQALSTLRMQIAQRTIAGPGLETQETHQLLLTEWQTEKEQLEAELARQIPEMKLKEQLLMASRENVAKLLPEGAVLVEFIRLSEFDFRAVPAQGQRRQKSDRYLAFIFSKQNPNYVKLIDLGEAESIDQMISDYKTSVMESTNELEHGAILRSAVFDPLVPALSGSTRIFLAPDSNLSIFPFEVLPKECGSRLIDEYEFSYLGVSRDALRFEQIPTNSPNQDLVVADPNFDLCGASAKSLKNACLRNTRTLKALLSNFSFERLPGTRLEGQDIAEILSVQPLLGDSVLESRLKSHKSPRILHIATHGFFLKDIEGSMVKAKYDPTLSALPTGNSLFCILSSSGIDDLLHRSGLALAGANTWSKGEPLPDEAEDGILTAADVSGLDLVDTELVVLSACETGLGNIKQGEGVFGLQRAFTLAGANTVVMSLWNVPDKETRELMVDFYGRITNGQPRAEALRQAQMAMKKKYPDPLYWGAFICLGDPSPLPHYETVN